MANEEFPTPEKNELPLVLQQELFGGSLSAIRDDAEAYAAYVQERTAQAKNGAPTYIATRFSEDSNAFTVDYYSDAARRAEIAYDPNAETVVTWAENGVEVAMSLEEAMWATKMLGYSKKAS